MIPGAYCEPVRLFRLSLARTKRAPAIHRRPCYCVAFVVGDRVAPIARGAKGQPMSGCLSRSASRRSSSAKRRPDQGQRHAVAGGVPRRPGASPEVAEWPAPAPLAAGWPQPRPVRRRLVGHFVDRRILDRDDRLRRRAPLENPLGLVDCDPVEQVKNRASPRNRLMLRQARRNASCVACSASAPVALKRRTQSLADIGDRASRLNPGRLRALQLV